MGHDNITETCLTFKLENENISISPLKDKNCDSTKSFSLENLFNSIGTDTLCVPNLEIRKITVLELSYCNLTDVPLSCKNLNLRHLGLSHNKLTSIPTCLYTGLKHLRSLDLSHNMLSNFDMEPECLPVVKRIKLNNNKFENVPKWLLTFRCINLESFDYSNNKARHYKYLKNSFSLNRIKLCQLELRNTYLIDEDYGFLKCFKSLQYLDISNEDSKGINIFNDLDDLFVKPKWKELRVLKLNSLSISIFPEGIAWIESLKELYISKNSISWLPDGIEFLVNLEVLDISKNDIVALPGKITALALKTIMASDNYIEIIPDFSLMRSLTTLDLYNNLLDAISFDFSSIASVDLEDNYFDTKNLENHSAYQEKKSFFRQSQDVISRLEGPKEYRNVIDSPERTGDSDESYSVDKNVNVDLSRFEETENWDLPPLVRPRNPEIDSIDDDWLGEEGKYSAKRFVGKGKVYISDEDWMYADVEEI